MTSLHAARSLALGVAVALAAGCGNQPTSVQVADGTSQQSTRASRILETSGPILCFFNVSFEYCYPTPGYYPGPESEILFKVYAGSTVTMNWSAQADPDRTIRSYRWSLDIEDISDNTPRIDEATDLAHWSAPSATATTATLGPWGAGEEHLLYVDVEDSMGYRSLGIVRFVSRGGRPILPPGLAPAQQATRDEDD